MGNSFKRGSSAFLLSLLACAVIGAVKISPAAVNVADSHAALAPAAAPTPAAPAIVARHIATAAINTSECCKITPDTAGASVPFTSFHSDPLTVTGNDRNALRNDMMSFGTTFTADYRLQISPDLAPTLNVDMPTVLASGAPVGMFR